MARHAHLVTCWFHVFQHVVCSIYFVAVVRPSDPNSGLLSVERLSLLNSCCSYDERIISESDHLVASCQDVYLRDMGIRHFDM
eukprot:1431304-Amphidinium_carterae.1